ncbi:hypothetical protein ES703_89771 [subsurface metagenome]
MQIKVAKVSKQLADIISGWEGIEAIVLGEAAEIKTLDPYFNIYLDVYHRGNLLPVNDRKLRLQNPVTFATALTFPEDRFLINDLPVRIRYQDMARFDLILKRIEDKLWVYRESGTCIFYRIENGQVLFQKSGWLDKIRGKLSELSEHFWEVILESTGVSVEYYLNDLNAAVFRNDNLYYLISASCFIRSMCSFLFALNRCFEPSGRMAYEKVKGLPKLPDEFAGRFESFLRDAPELPAQRKREIAELLARSILSMT